MSKLDAANYILCNFSESKLERKTNGWYVTWMTGKEKYTRRWQCKGQDFYPVWSNKWPCGGTACVALSQLIRWNRNQPVLPLTTWRYWSTDHIGLIDPSILAILKENNYPQEAICVLCNKKITGGLDWWHLDKKSGPCCSYLSGCRQKR